MKKVFLVLLFIISLFAKSEHENIKSIELTKSQGSSWIYEKDFYPLRDQVLHGLKIKQKKEKLLVKFNCGTVQVDNRYAKILSVEPYSITSLVVSTNKRVLLDIRLKNLYKRGLGVIGLELDKHPNEKHLTFRFTDDHNHVTLYGVDISRNPSTIKRDYTTTDYENLNPEAWKITNITIASKEIFGDDIAKKVKELYKDLKRNNARSADEQGTFVVVENSKKISKLAILSTTTKSQNVLAVMVHIPDKDVHFLNLTTSFNIPSWKDGEILVIGEDKKGRLHMSQLLHINSLVGHGNAEGPGIFKTKLDK